MFQWFSNQDIIIKTLLATLFTWSITTLGSSIVFFFKKINKNILNSMLGFSAGIMIAASYWSLLNPAINLANSLKINSWLIILIGFLSGATFLYFGDNVYDCYLKYNNKVVSKNFKRIFMLVFSITLHNIPEGLAVGVAFGSLKYGTGSTLMSSMMLALGIGIQNFPEGSAISLPLRGEGYSRLKSFIYGSLSGIVEPIAALIGVLLVTKIRTILPFFLSFAAGAMIYVVIKEIIPESQSNKNTNLVTLWTIFGFALMMVLDVALS